MGETSEGILRQGIGLRYRVALLDIGLSESYRVT